MEFLYLIIGAILVFFLTIVAFTRRYKRCPSDKILVVYGKIAGGGRGGLSAKCYHGGAAFIWPLLQDYSFLDLRPMAIDINLQGALSLQNIRVNTPSTFTVGISTEPGVMENAAERLLAMDHKQISELARDLIFGQMRVVLATMPIEEINADRDKLIEKITDGVEVELNKVGLRLINVNIQDITDESGYIDALGRDAAARAINEAKVKVAEKERDGEIGAAAADRDRRVQVAQALATAVEGENTAKVTIANSDAARREREAEAERLASAAEKVKSAQALEEAYKAEEGAERQRAQREQATQRANVLVPAEIKKAEIETLSEAEAERTRRIKKGEADGLRFQMQAQADGTLFQRTAEADGTRLQMQAEADGLKARLLGEAAGLIEILNNKAEGFGRIVGAVAGDTEKAALLLVTEQLPKLIEEQVKAISNLKIDSVTVWEGGRGGGGGKNATADFLSGLVGSLPPLHELTKNVGVRLPEYLGRMEQAGRGGREPGHGGGRGKASQEEGGDGGDDGPAGGGGARGPSSPRGGAAAARGAGEGRAGGRGASTSAAAGRRGGAERAGAAAGASLVAFPSTPVVASAADDLESPSLAALHRATADRGYGGTPAGLAAGAAVTAEPAVPASRPSAGPRGAGSASAAALDAAGERERAESGGPAGEDAGSRPTEVADKGAGSRPVRAAAADDLRRARAEPPAGAAAGEPHRAEPTTAAARRAAAALDATRTTADRGREKLRSWLAADPRILGIPGAEAASAKAMAAVDAAVDSAFEWADRVRDTSAAWFHAEGGKWIGPETWRELSRVAGDRPGLPVNLDRKPVWLPYQAITRALESERRR
jgi:flotillin